MSAALAWLLLAAAGSELTATNPYSLDVDASAKVVLGTRWRKAVVRQGFDREVLSTFGRPGVASHFGLVITGTGEGKVLALTQRDGALLWEKSLGMPIESPVSVFGDGIAQPEWFVVCLRNGQLVAMSVANGAELWRADLGGESRAPVILQGERLFATTSANKLVALEAKTGAVLWSAGRPPSQGLTVEGHAAAVADATAVYTTFADGYAEAFRADDGSRLWSRPLSLSGGEFIDADADPVVIGDTLYVASYADGIYALRTSDGSTLYNLAAPGVVSLAATPQGLAAGSSDGYVWILAPKDGALRSRTRLPKGPMSRFIVVGDLLVFTHGETGLLVIDAINGKPLQASAYPDRLQGDPGFAPRPGMLATLSASGHLYTFRLGGPSWVR